MEEEKQLPATTRQTTLAIPAASPLLNRGLTALRRGAEEDDAEKQYQQALALCEGVDFVALSEINLLPDVPVDWSRHPAVALFTSAAKQDHRDSKFCLGVTQAHTSPLAAVDWYRKASEQGHPEAAFQYVKYLLLDPSTSRSSFAEPLSWEKACGLLQVAAAEGHVRAATELAYLLLTAAEDPETKERDSFLAQASILFRKVAEAGNADAAFRYAELVALGDGTVVNYDEAARWYAFAAERGHRKAMFELAYMYERGLGVPAETLAAADLYRRAGQQAHKEGALKDAASAFECAGALGDVESAYLAGMTILEICQGDNATKTRGTPTALKWLERAHELGHADAPYQLGLLYSESEWPGYAAAWYRKAAERGNKEGQFITGSRCESDSLFVDAVRWYRKAAEQGHIEAAYRLGFRLRWGSKDVQIDEKKRRAG